jgi:hypothetical protein
MGGVKQRDHREFPLWSYSRLPNAWCSFKGQTNNNIDSVTMRIRLARSLSAMSARFLADRVSTSAIFIVDNDHGSVIAFRGDARFFAAAGYSGSRRSGWNIHAETVQ